MRKLALLMAFIMAFTSVAPAYAETPEYAAVSETETIEDYNNVSSIDVSSSDITVGDENEGINDTDISSNESSQEEDTDEETTIDDDPNPEEDIVPDISSGEIISEPDARDEAFVPGECFMSSSVIKESYDYGSGYYLGIRIYPKEFNKNNKPASASIDVVINNHTLSRELSLDQFKFYSSDYSTLEYTFKTEGHGFSASELSTAFGIDLTKSYDATYVLKLTASNGTVYKYTEETKISFYDVSGSYIKCLNAVILHM